MSQFLLTEVVNRVATIRLNRPEKLNAFTDDMIAAWIELLEGYATSPDVHVIVITGTGRAFTTGGDLGTFTEHASATAEDITARLKATIQRLALTIEAIDKPVIAAVNGLATGGGVDVALMCDLRFAARSARLAETYVRVGLIPGAGGAYLLPRLVGPARALELFWSSDSLTAEQAERIGLVNRVFDDDLLTSETQAFAERLALGAPLAVRLVKRLVYQGLGTDFPAALEQAASEMPQVRMSEDHKEAIAAFREKRSRCSPDAEREDSMTDSEEARYPAPVANADSRAYWEAAAREELLIRRCTSCGKHHFPPRFLCPTCWSEDLEWTKSSGQGVVYTVTVMHRAPMPMFATRVPYVVALVDLDEGPRMMANIVGEAALQTKIGERVAVCFEKRGESAKVPQFRRSAT